VISGTDDRIAFVIQTEAQLDGIRAARGEVRGLGTDASASAQRLSQASKAQADAVAAVANMSAKSRASFDQMSDAEKRATLSLMGVSTAEQKAALGATELGAAITSNATAVNMQIGAFVRRGEVIDKTSVAALEAYRAEGDALSANLARLGATEQELNKIGVAITRAEQQGGAATAFGPQLGPALPPGGLNPGAIDNTDKALKRIPGSARTAANALALLSNSALMGTGSTQGLLVAAGGLATGLAALSKSAAIAAGASGIGAVVTIAAVVVNAFEHMGDAAKATQMDVDHLSTFTAQTMPGQIMALKQARDTAIAAATAAAAGLDSSEGFLQRMLHRRQPGEGVIQDIADTFGLSSPAQRAMQKLDDLYSAAIPKAGDLARAERLRVLALNDQIQNQIKSNDLELEGKHRVEDVYDLSKRRISDLYAQIDLQKQGIEREFISRDNQGHIIALTAEQIQQKQKLLDQADENRRLQLNEILHEQQLADIAYRNAARIAAATGPMGGHDVKGQYEARLAQINAEAAAELEQNPQREVDIEAQKQAKIRALRRDTARAAMEDAKSLTAVLIDSGSKQVRAVGHAAETIRRVVIGAQAAHAAVEAAIEGGKAIGSLAALDFRGAALHGAAALELAKAAALGAQESLGGGRTASGGGGGAAGGNSQTFEPRSAAEASSGFNLTVITQNALGPDHIQNIAFQLNRSGILKQPLIEIPATTGITVRAA
jgi:hypothetical protein